MRLSLRRDAVECIDRALRAEIVHQEACIEFWSRDDLDIHKNIRDSGLENAQKALPIARAASMAIRRALENKKKDPSRSSTAARV